MEFLRQLIGIDIIIISIIIMISFGVKVKPEFKAARTIIYKAFIVIYNLGMLAFSAGLFWAGFKAAFLPPPDGWVGEGITGATIFLGIINVFLMISVGWYLYRSAQRMTYTFRMWNKRGDLLCRPRPKGEDYKAYF